MEIGKNLQKEEKLGIKGKNQEGSFPLPLLKDRAGYATASTKLSTQSVKQNMRKCNTACQETICQTCQ